MKKILFLGVLILGVSLFEVITFASDVLDKKPIIESVDDPEVYRSKPIDIFVPEKKAIQKSSAPSINQSLLNNPQKNLITNPSVEDSFSTLPQNWYKGGYGLNNRIFSYPVKGIDGGNAIKINISAYTSGDAKWYFDDVPVSVGNTYQFSDYYLSDTPSIVDVRFKMKDGTYMYKDIAFVDANPGSDFKKVTVDFVIPQNVVSITIFHLIKTTGSLTTDNYFLSDITPTQESNLILNSNLEQSTLGGMPVNWKKGGWGTNIRNFLYPLTSYDGSKAAKVEITKYTSGDAKWYFIPISISPGTYTYSENFFSNIDSVLTIQYQNIANEYTYKDIAKFLKSSGSSYDYLERDIFIPSTIKNITIFHLIEKVGSLSIDNASLKLKKDLTGVFTTGAVTFRFDDGLESQYVNAIPKLNSRGFKGTFFITTQQLFENGFSGFLNQSQLREMYNQGHEIGAHTRTHAHLTRLTASQQEEEIKGSRNDLIAMGLGVPKSFSYPFGEYNEQTIQIVKKSGFSNAVSVVDEYILPISDPYQLERKEIIVTTTLDQIKKMVDEAVRDKKWLVFEIHDINDSGNLYSTNKEIFDQTVEYVYEKKIPVVTIEEGMKSF